jgi:hypothetical protein
MIVQERKNKDILNSNRIFAMPHSTATALHLLIMGKVVLGQRLA